MVRHEWLRPYSLRPKRSILRDVCSSFYGHRGWRVGKPRGEKFVVIGLQPFKLFSPYFFKKKINKNVLSKTSQKLLKLLKIWFPNSREEGGERRLLCPELIIIETMNLIKQFVPTLLRHKCAQMRENASMKSMNIPHGERRLKNGDIPIRISLSSWRVKRYANLKVEVDFTSTFIYGTGVPLYILILNLMANAIKSHFTAQGCLMQTSRNGQTEGHPIMKLDGMAILEVADTPVGFLANTSERR